MIALAQYFALEDAEDAIEEENSKKLDEISAMLKKEQGTKVFATVGCLVGFEDGIDLVHVESDSGIVYAHRNKNGQRAHPVGFHRFYFK